MLRHRVTLVQRVLRVRTCGDASLDVVTAIHSAPQLTACSRIVMLCPSKLPGNLPIRQARPACPDILTGRLEPTYSLGSSTLANHINVMAAKPVLSSPKRIKGLSATCKTASLACDAPVTAVISLEGSQLLL
jgi:hypothetical protein